MDNLKKYVKKKKDAFSETPKITKISRKKISEGRKQTS